MRDVSQYFELIEKDVEYSPATEAEIEILRFDAKSGLIEGVLYFADGSRLEFTERVVIEQRRLVKQEYRYQFVRNEEAVFRYDNAPHHTHISTHPHHKHVGAKILPALEPEFSHVLDEAVALFVEDTGYVKRGGKKTTTKNVKEKLTVNNSASLLRG
jgi:hypothetical protein